MYKKRKEHKIHGRKNYHHTVLRPKISIKGTQWDFHKGDEDDHPSVPHGHSVDRKFKLELWNGNIYEVQTGKLKHKAKKKDMERLYNYPGFLDFVLECREEYMTRNPAISLPELSSGYYRRKVRSCTVKKADSYSFYIRYD